MLAKMAAADLQMLSDLGLLVLRLPPSDAVLTGDTEAQVFTRDPVEAGSIRCHCLDCPQS